MTKIKPLHERLFPQLAKSKWACGVKLDEHAQHTRFLGEAERKDTFLNPYWCERYVNSFHRTLPCDYSYGGYGEDRSEIWKGSYLEEKKAFIHLGIDYNVPAGTAVYLPVDAFIIRQGTDSDQDGGWGSFVDFFFEPGERFKNETLVAFERNRYWHGIESSNAMYVRFAHLHQNYRVRKPMVVAKKGTLLGYVGNPRHNGYWYPHLHVQCMDAPFIRNTFQWDRYEFDGYGVDLGRSVDPEKVL